MVVQEKSQIALEQNQVPDNKQQHQSQMDNNLIGKNLRSALLRGHAESRVIVGLSAAVKFLSVVPEDSLFCVLAPPNKGDTATHMHEVLLQAFCFENDIYIIKVDSSEKLSRLLNSNTTESCVLVQKSWSSNKKEEQLTSAEEALVDYCEDHWDAPKQPVVKLPEL